MIDRLSLGEGIDSVFLLLLAGRYSVTRENYYRFFFFFSGYLCLELLWLNRSRLGHEVLDFFVVEITLEF
jgi:hypothetical protein